MSALGAEAPEADHHPPTCEPQVSAVVKGSGESQASMNPVQVSTPVPSNVFTGTLQGTLGFITAQFRVLVEEGYYTQD